MMSERIKSAVIAGFIVFAVLMLLQLLIFGLEFEVIVEVIPLTPTSTSIPIP